MQELLDINTLDEAVAWLNGNRCGLWSVKKLISYGASRELNLCASSPNWKDLSQVEYQTLAQDGTPVPVYYDGLVNVDDFILSSILKHGNASLAGARIGSIEIGYTAETPIIDSSHLRIYKDELERFAKTIGLGNIVAKAPTHPDQADITTRRHAQIPTPWVEMAKQIADRIGRERWDAGVRHISAHNISEAVTEELAKDSTTHGIQGARCDNTVRTKGLKGWKFVPPSEGTRVD